jgi:hypothetical protein
VQPERPKPDPMREPRTHDWLAYYFAVAVLIILFLFATVGVSLVMPR